MAMQAQQFTVCTFLLTVPSVPLNSAFVGNRSVALEWAPESAAESSAVILSPLVLV